MKNVHGVLIFHVQSPQCLYLVVMIIRYYAMYFSILTKIFCMLKIMFGIALGSRAFKVKKSFLENASILSFF